MTTNDARTAGSIATGLQRFSSGAVAPSQSVGSAPHVPTYSGDGLPLSEGQPLRDECWSRLGPKLTSRMGELAGDPIGWFAEARGAGDGRPRAVLLGELGLCIAEPRLDATQRPVYSLSCYKLAPDSHRSVRIEHRPEYAPIRARIAGRAQQQPPTNASGDIHGLSHADKKTIGNLPYQAQELLQAPFALGQQVNRCEHYYQGILTRLDVYLTILAGERDVTAVTGSQFVPVKHSSEGAHWMLDCHRLSVTGRIGN